MFGRCRRIEEELRAVGSALLKLEFQLRKAESRLEALEGEARESTEAEHQEARKLEKGIANLMNYDISIARADR